MNLAFSSVSELYVNHEKLFVVVNTWAEAHAYALNIKRSSKNKREIKDKIWLKCDEDDKNSSSVEQKRLHVDSRLIECSFKAIAKWSLDETSWLLRIEDSAHNHCSILSESHSTLKTDSDQSDQSKYSSSKSFKNYTQANSHYSTFR